MKKSTYEFTDYKALILEWVESSPKKGRGLLSRMAESAQVHITTFSQVVRGSRQLSLEQADLVARFMGLSEAEREYFVLLVNLERAGSASLREMFAKQIRAKQKEQESLAYRVVRSRELSSEERAIFYSNWIYAAVRNLTAIPGYHSPKQISERLRLAPEVLEPVLEFLLQCGLCIKKGTALAPGPQLTHLEGSSPLVARHHGNWRVKAMDRHPMIRDTQEELAYSSPVTLSSNDVKKIRALLANLVQSANRIIQPSSSERLFCLNLDWFEIF